MGWDFTKGATKAKIVASLIPSIPIRPETEWSNKDQRSIATGYDVAYNTLHHKVIGSVLWMVGEIVRYKDGEEVSRKRHIACYLLQSKKDFGWGYKGMSEMSHPFQYSCPLNFLDEVPIVNEEWRKEVREWHKRNTRNIEVGKRYKLLKCRIDEVCITFVSPKKILGTGQGQVWRLKKDMIGDEV